MNVEMADATLPSNALESSIFDRWAEVYDSESNPLLRLEERHASAMLPPLTGCSVLDAGCGTGRWLRNLEMLGAAPLAGLDCSSGMLRRASEKLRSTTRLHRGHCSALPAQNASVHLIVASFVLSYLDDLETFAAECERVIQPGGWLLISDMHPATAADRGWKRGFSVDREKVEISAYTRSLEAVTDIFREHGFEVDARTEPAFGLPERDLFASAGKLPQYEVLQTKSAIYILKLRKRGRSRLANRRESKCTLQLVGGHIAFGPDTWTDKTIKIEGGRIASLEESVDASYSTFDITGFSILPGLINAHDHLEFGLFPRLGRATEEPHFANSAEWAREIHSAHVEIIRQYQSIPKRTRLWWGALRNLLCGVTTVCHHNPASPEFNRPEFPVRVVSRFGWAHSLAFEPEITQRFHDTPLGSPFIVHAAEGIDRESHDEIIKLDRMGVLDQRSVIVHGLALDPEGIALINDRGAALVVCPTSNAYLFGNTLPPDVLFSVQRLALGSDSSLTADGDLLDEIRYLHSVVGLAPQSIYQMVTSRPSEMLRLEEGLGKIEISGAADLVAVRGHYTSPASALAGLSFADIELVLRSGRIFLASDLLFRKLAPGLRRDMQCLEIGGHRRWVRAPLHELFDTAEAILGKDSLVLGGKPVRYVGSL